MAIQFERVLFRCGIDGCRFSIEADNLLVVSDASLPRNIGIATGDVINSFLGHMERIVEEDSDLLSAERRGLHDEAFISFQERRRRPVADIMIQHGTRIAKVEVGNALKALLADSDIRVVSYETHTFNNRGICSRTPSRTYYYTSRANG